MNEQDLESKLSPERVPPSPEAIFDDVESAA